MLHGSCGMKAVPATLDLILDDLALVEVPSSQSPVYSARRASTGFTDAARRAGRKLAAIDARANSRATRLRVTASQACTPNNRLRMSSDDPTEQTSPIANPVAVSHPA